MSTKGTRLIWRLGIPCVLAVCAVYIGGYFMLGKPYDIRLAQGDVGVLRVYKTQWLANAFATLARAETMVRGKRVGTISEQRLEVLVDGALFGDDRDRAVERR